jgi:hypothetical protein
VTRVIELVEAHYEIQDVEMGRSYKWCPEKAVVECACGNRETFVAFRTPTCGKCGADHADIVGEALDTCSVDKIDRPWRSLNPYYTPTRGT